MSALTCLPDDRATAAQIAAAMRLSDRAIRKRSATEAWPFDKAPGRGGGKAFPVATLPAAVQQAVIMAFPATAEAVAKPAAFSYSAESLWAHWERKRERQKAKARAALALLLQVEALVDAGASRGEAFRLVAQANDQSWRTLQNWYHGKPGKPGVKYYARQDWLAALVPGNAGGAPKAGCAVEAWEFFKADYLRLERPGAAACYERLKAAAQAHGWQIPCLRTLQRRIEKEVPAVVQVLAREGELAANKLYPAQQRTVRDLHALAWINGDGYQHNVFVKWPDGSIARPKTWFWQDIYSRMVLGWRTDLTEHTDVIRLSFGDLVEAYGLPDDITIDNTRAAANKWMTGGVAYRNRYKVQAEDVLGLWPTLGIRVHWTKLDQTAGGKNVGHGQAKPIERAFGWGGLGEYVDKHPAFAGAWCGNSTQDKPENYASKAVPLETFMTVLSEVMRAWNTREGRQTEACGGVLSYQQAFAASYEHALIRKPTAEQRRLWLLPAEAARVQRDGTVSLDAGSAPGMPKNRYWSELLTQHIGHKVVLRFDPDDLHGDVQVYTLDSRYIGAACCLQPVGYGDTQAGREHNRARAQWKRAERDKLRAEIKMDALQAAKLLPATEQPDPPESKLARVFQPARAAVGAAIDISAEEQAEMAANFKRNVLRLAQREE